MSTRTQLVIAYINSILLLLLLLAEDHIILIHLVFYSQEWQHCGKDFQKDDPYYYYDVSLFKSKINFIYSHLHLAVTKH